MLFLLLLLLRPQALLSLVLVFCSAFPLSAAGPLYRQLPYYHHTRASGAQQLLPEIPAMQSLATTKAPSFDVQENSIGVLFTTGDGWEVLHVWLPLGRKIFTRDVPHIPLRPHTARITTMIRSTPQTAAPEILDRVVCEIFPKDNRTRDARADLGEGRQSISFSRSDDLVRLAEAGSAAWHSSREVEAYECVVPDEV